MAAGLKRDPILFLRIDSEDLREFIESSRFEPEMIAIFSHMESANAPLRESITRALGQLTVEHGVPPASDSWVLENIVEPALKSFSMDDLELPASQDTFLEEFKKLAASITRCLQEQPVIVAHTENTFDGNGVSRLLSDKFELEKLLDGVWRDLPKDHNQKVPKVNLRIALDGMAALANMPPYVAVY